MNFQPQPDPHKLVIQQLSAQIDHYLATGNRIHIVEPGVSGEVPFTAISNHPKNLKARRDKHAPKVLALAANRMTASAIATTMGLDSRTIRRIAKENGIALAEPT